jgi:TerC family integral membrane protein
MDSALLPLFAALLGGAFLLDLGILRRGPDRERSTRAALAWTGLWVTLALAFGLVVAQVKGGDAAFAYLTAYLVEWSLSLDNVFAFALIFTAFKVPADLQRRPLALGIAGALVLRLALISAGIGLIEHFEWLLPLFGLVLLVTAGRMLRSSHSDDTESAEHPLLHALQRRLPFTHTLHGSRYTIVMRGRRLLTPLGLVVVAIIGMDIVFAVDSIPAVIAISPDTFVIATSNAFALMGLRSLYVLLAAAKDRFVYLSYGLAAALAFIGGKLILGTVAGLHLPTVLSLIVVLGCLALSVIVSLLAERRR